MLFNLKFTIEMKGILAIQQILLDFGNLTANNTTEIADTSGKLAYMC